MRTLSIIIASLLISTPAYSKNEPEISGIALQQIQAQDFEASSDIVFPAVMTVLQDSGYRILAADRATGLITAQGSTESKLSYNILFGFGQKKKVPIISAFIEARSANFTRARLNFVMSTGKSRNAFTDEKPISDPAVYKDAFERIQKEIFVRQSMAAPTPVAPTVQPAPPQGAPATATP